MKYVAYQLLKQKWPGSSFMSPHHLGKKKTKEGKNKLDLGQLGLVSWRPRDLESSSEREEAGFEGPACSFSCFVPCVEGFRACLMGRTFRFPMEGAGETSLLGLGAGIVERAGTLLAPGVGRFSFWASTIICSSSSPSLSRFGDGSPVRSPSCGRF